MKNKFYNLPILVVLTLFITSCSSVRVIADYDKQVNFDNYQTFAFYKTGIDKAEISDLDKRRILKAIESELLAKGFTKSENPDLLVSIIASSREKIDVYNNFYGPGWGWGWNPYFYGNYNTVSTSTEGVLYIDLIDANKKELVWQGQGVGYLSVSNNIDKKEARIKEFVNTILEKYPPQKQ
ncbi:DUF4136 domain-containing protein [Hanstruepera neustonica]|uniref:DUF4136 domain-containing protein n=1 Tax=Hanstruepera neustonica TaxID=1445657 RepID=A0A2K1E0P1_9FLAO|nr:DUF4136 domain-containing protein [Hanstruepera neustonica]PNQ73825.1 DUF4136 domain-containing protein [Hanstruepera neustonica]